MMRRSVLVGLVACAAVPADAFGFSALHPIQVSVLARRNSRSQAPGGLVLHIGSDLSSLRALGDSAQGEGNTSLTGIFRATPASESKFCSLFCVHGWFRC